MHKVKPLFFLLVKFLIFLIIITFSSFIIYSFLNSSIFLKKDVLINSNIKYFDMSSKSENFNNQSDNLYLQKINSILFKSEIPLNNNNEVYTFSNVYNFNNDIIGYLSIPKISLYNAPIKKGVGQDILKDAVGLFENSSIDTGNVCLAAHNRSTTVSYFLNLCKLTKGDYIILKTKENISKFCVEFLAVIESNDWTYLQNEKFNAITCITCIDNKPNKRLCVRGIKET